MKNKLVSMTQAADLIKDNQLLALGGNALHRTPTAFAYELGKRNLKGLKICGAAPGLASDMLCAAGLVDTVYFGFFGFENEYGLAAGMRKGCQNGTIKAMEGS